jgi:hypothetical protein
VIEVGSRYVHILGVTTFFLWIAFAVVAVIAFFAILVTGRGPDPGRTGQLKDPVRRRGRIAGEVAVPQSRK